MAREDDKKREAPVGQAVVLLLVAAAATAYSWYLRVPRPQPGMDVLAHDSETHVLVVACALGGAFAGVVSTIVALIAYARGKRATGIVALLAIGITALAGIRLSDSVDDLMALFG